MNASKHPILHAFRLLLTYPLFALDDMKPIAPVESTIESRALLALRTKTPKDIAAVFIGGHSFSSQVPNEFATRPDEFAEPMRQAILLLKNPHEILGAAHCLSDALDAIHSSATRINPFRASDESTAMLRYATADARLAAFAPCVTALSHCWTSTHSNLFANPFQDIIRHVLDILSIVDTNPTSYRSPMPKPAFTLALAEALNQAPERFRSQIAQHYEQWKDLMPPSPALMLAASLREAQAIGEAASTPLIPRKAPPRI